ncbi:hypothetical protein CRG98_035972 [Punica granatum]|uniref:Uncharacterized protein n=1 Tax=Punica granatum TaxID=22663 RepID=A0A2I0II11_PUNGR|nr:hypothetical protein CRG98_035972 [Punica granatum]
MTTSLPMTGLDKIQPTKGRLPTGAVHIDKQTHNIKNIKESQPLDVIQIGSETIQDITINHELTRLSTPSYRHRGGGQSEQRAVTIKDAKGPDQYGVSGHGPDPSRDRSSGRSEGDQPRWSRSSGVIVKARQWRSGNGGANKTRQWKEEEDRDGEPWVEGVGRWSRIWEKGAKKLIETDEGRKIIDRIRGQGIAARREGSSCGSLVVDLLSGFNRLRTHFC